MKATLHLGRGKASHNDRHFDLDKADHIDKDKQGLNSNVIWSTDSSDQRYTFEEWERKYYEDHYSESLTATNERYIAQRHPEKCRTMEDWMKTYKPTEAIIQLGNAEEQIDHQYLIKSAMETISELKEKYPQFVPLDLAIHRDETTPHIHLRFVIEGHDKSGHLKPLKTQGLKEMGIECPDMSKPEGRHNNPLMTFTAEARKILYKKIEELGLDLDKTPHLNQQHKETLQFKKDELVADIESLQLKKDELAADIESLERERIRLQVSVNEKAEREKQLDASLASLNKMLDDKNLSYEQICTMEEMHYTQMIENEEAKKRLEKELAAIEQDIADKEEEVAEREKLIAEREAKIVQKEKAIEGRELKPDEFKDLEQKTIWSSEDKQNVLKTAKLSAKYHQRNKTLKAENEELSKDVERMKPHYEDYDRVKAQVRHRDETKIPKLEKEIESLKTALKVRDDFIEQEGIKDHFLNFCTEIGYKIKTAVQNLDFGISR